jgi:hypothetical protein
MRLERWVVKLGVAGFLIHLTLVFLSRTLPHPPVLLAAAGANYLSAISTPFTFILFYEVLVLIAALPESLAQSVANQFEIVSLIFLRGFFKDLADIDDIGKFRQSFSEMLPVVTDVCAGLLMFLLVTVFQHVSLRRRRADAGSGQSTDVRNFVASKKAIALALTVWLVALTLYTLAEFGHDSYNLVYHATKAVPDLQTHFYTDVFSVMIFADVLILNLSLGISDRYAQVFRNAAFVFSTILIRFSLTADRPYGSPLALLGMIFGILTMLIYTYNASIHFRFRDANRNTAT